jgi:isochorismate synthase
MPRPLPDTLGIHLEKGLPLVAYRKPGQEVLTLLFQDDRARHGVNDFTESGFVFAPFDLNSPPILLQPDSSQELRFPAGISEEKSTRGFENSPTEDREVYVELVRSAQQYMAEGNCMKIVVSRSQEVETHVQPLHAFDMLLQMYPDAFCYLWHHPDTGIWIGASPELLLKVEENIYQTTSLAGTARYEGEPEPHWGPKEREEQAIVTSFLLDAIRGKVATVNITGPVTIKAADLLHLQSRISGELGPARLADLIAALHPSPAVCGLPRKEALDFINRHENYNRAFYTGYLGELNMPASLAAGSNQQAQLYVNLRCMSFSRGYATLYVGGGVTPASSPQAEWEETVNKSGTMRRVLMNSPE